MHKKIIRTQKKKKKYSCQTCKRIVKRQHSQHGSGNLMCENILGQGGFGTVFKCSIDGLDYAVKFLKTSTSTQNNIFLKQLEKQEIAQKNEMEIYKYIYDSSHKINNNILKFFDLSTENEIIFSSPEYNKLSKKYIFGTELCNFDLLELIIGSKVIDDLNIDGKIYTITSIRTVSPDIKNANSIKVLWYIISQIFNGLRGLFEMKIIHSDIKPENILVKKEQGGKYTFKICDFGFAAKHENFNLSESYDTRLANNNKYSRGTTSYMITSMIYLCNTFFKDLVAFAIMLYLLVILDKCEPANKQIKSISDLKTCFKNFNNTQVTPIINELITLEKKININKNDPISNHNEDYTQYQPHYDTIAKLINDMKDMEDIEDMNNTPKVGRNKVSPNATSSFNATSRTSHYERSVSSISSISSIPSKPNNYW